MTADIIIDFDHHLDHGCVWHVQVELEFLDHPEDVPGCMDVDIYVIAPDRNLAQYIATTFYPDAESISIGESSVTREEYVSRRNPSKV